MRVDAIVSFLKAAQQLNNWPRKRLALEIGVHPRLIDALYQGKRGIGADVLGRIGRRFPGLKEEIWDALIAQDEHA